MNLLMRTDPFREHDRVTEQVFAASTRSDSHTDVPRRDEDELVVDST